MFVNEIHDAFLAIYRHSRRLMGIPEPKYGYHSDITVLLQPKPAEQLHGLVAEAREHHELVGFIGGPPCPDFSVGGKNRGRHGDHGKLSATYVELICQQQPDFFLFENVKGLWCTKKHRVFFEELKQRLHQAGYSTTERLINAIEYGVPQDRDRIILIGFKGEVIRDLGLSLDRFPWTRYVKYPRETVFSLPWPKRDPFGENVARFPPAGIIEELTVEYWFRINDVLNHPNAGHHFIPRAGLARMLTVDEGDDSRKSYKRLHRWRYSPTAAYGNNEVHLHPYKARRISVAEALAIQSLPKEFEVPADLSLTDMFKAIGNGVPYLAAKGLAQTIAEFLGVSLQSTSKPTLSISQV